MLGFICAASANSVKDPTAIAWRDRIGVIKGVNLGGWLLLERWLVDFYESGVRMNTTCCGEVNHPFHNLSWDEAPDEYSLGGWLRGTDEVDRFREWREAFITRDDLVAIKATGLNSVRVPFGYWIVSDSIYPSDYYTGAGLLYLERVLEWAAELGLTVLLDLHGGPGGQGPEMTCGRKWHDWDARTSFNVSAAVETVRVIAARLGNASALIGIELLNEPEMPADILNEFYGQACRAVRQEGVDLSKVAIVIQLFGLETIFTHAWGTFNHDPALSPEACPNIIYDLHLYYIFLPSFFDIFSLDWVVTTLVDLQSSLLDYTGRPSFVGEWSTQVAGGEGALNAAFSSLTPEEQTSLLRSFGARQQRSIASGDRFGGYFWTWKVPIPPPADARPERVSWSLKDVIARGWVSFT